MAGTINNTPRICLLAAPETSPSVLYGLYDVLSTAGAIYPEMTGAEAAEPLLDVKVVAATAEPFRCYGNVLVEPDFSVETLVETDVVIVCDMYQPIDQPPRGRYRAEISWINRMHSKGAIIASVCSGSVILAEAGLLNGLEAAGHWAYRDMFRKHYPEVTMRENSIICLAGERERIVTAAAVSSWQELAIITRLCGAEQAIQSAKIFLLTDRTDGQLPFSVTALPVQDSDAIVAKCQLWIRENLSVANPVQAMAAEAGLQSKAFARRFRAATGQQPMDYVQVLRVEQAKQILESSTDSVEDVALAVGYEDTAFFRRLFKRKAGLAPAAYRKKFAGLVPSGLH